MKLINALSEKNKLARNIKDIQERINQYNSYIAGNTPVYNINDQLVQLQKSIDDIVSIKSQISRANLEHIESIYRLSELKSLCSFLKKLKIKEGKVKEENYSADVNEWECEISNVERDKIVLELQAEIDLIQMKMDRFNFEQEI